MLSKKGSRRLVWMTNRIYIQHLQEMKKHYSSKLQSSTFQIKQDTKLFLKIAEFGDMMKTLWIILQFIIFSSVTVRITAQQEREALLNWKNSLNLPALPSWVSNGSSSHCNWTGIRCNEAGSVVEIDLEDSGVDGTLERFDFSAFPNLTSFSLTMNNIVGYLPADIGNATKLTFLDLSSNNITNPIPPEIGNLVELEFLNFYNNSFTGPIPYRLSNLQKLWHLDLGANYLEDPDPVQFKGMASLTELNFSYVLLKEVPQFIFECPKLIFVDLSDNIIAGMIPFQRLTSLQNLESLNLSRNSFEGTLPREIRNFTKIRDFRIGRNNLNGTIPDEISLLSNLEVLELQENRFAGPILTSLGNLKKLRTLNLRLAGLNSTIPDELSLCSNLTFLDLSSNSLTGPLPLSMTSLTQISILDISDNSLTGEIHQYLLSNWSELTSLLLHTNNLSGSIPPQIGSLHKLEYLYLYQNQLSGPLPSEIGELSSLLDLQLSYNLFSGPIPSTFGNLTSLRKLALSFNQINGTLPPEIGNMTSLQELDLTDNILQGTLPASITGLQYLTLFYVAYNNFSGIIPVDFSPDFLMNASFSYNNFSGELPSGICRGGYLVYLAANANNLVGPIPESLRNCTWLNRVRLEENLLEGDITNAFGVYPDLDFIDLGDNRLSGVLSATWGQCTSLSNFRIADNMISGSIPPNLGNLTLLQNLDLANNQFSGKIRAELFSSAKLLRLNLSHNHLTDQIPDEIRLLTQLQFLDLSQNNLRGPIPEELGDCRALIYLDLSENRLNGAMPYQIGNLVALQILLDLSQNSITGRITPQLGNLRKLEILNLSHNYLSGPIPSSLEDLMSLQQVDISYNALEGPLPDSKAFQEAPATALVGNPSLCGNNTQGLVACGGDSSSKKSKSNRKKLIIAIVVPLAVVGMLSILFGLIISCYRSRVPRDEKDNKLRSGGSFSIWNYHRKTAFKDIVEATKNFDDKYCIGRGGQGSVYKAILPAGDIFAVKRLHPCEEDEISLENQMKSFKSEMHSLTKIRHRNIVKMYGFSSFNGSIYFIYEFVERGNLGKLLQEDDDAKTLSWDRRLKVIKGVAHALSYLHHDCSSAIVHRDISGSNILLDENFEPKVSDFGTARLLRKGEANWTAPVGSFGYMAPELASTAKVTEKADVYSFGVIVLQVIVGQHPQKFLSSLQSEGYNQLFADILDKRLTPPTGLVLKELVLAATIALLCIKENPAARPTMDQISRELSANAHVLLPTLLQSLTLQNLIDLNSQEITNGAEQL